MKKINLKALILFLAIPLIVGGLAALLTMDGFEMYKTVEKPPLSPPAIVFPIAWTILYLMMGFASYLVYTAPYDYGSRMQTLELYFIHLVINFAWPIIFFNMKTYLAALVWLVFLWVAILAVTVPFFRIRKLAGWLMIPYLAWVTFAGYLNYGVWALNR